MPLVLKSEIFNWKSKRTTTSDVLFQNHLGESFSFKLNTHANSQPVSFVPSVKGLIVLVSPFGA